MIKIEESAKRELISFIKWKSQHEPEYFKEIEPMLKDMGLLELQRWAISNDYIDA